MMHDHRRGRTLSLNSFPWVVNDKRINQRHRSETKHRVIVGSESDTSPRKPLEISMFTQVHNRVRFELFADPKVEGQVGRWRREGRTVINRLRLQRVSARWLNSHKDVTQSYP